MRKTLASGCEVFINPPEQAIHHVADLAPVIRDLEAMAAEVERLREALERIAFPLRYAIENRKDGLPINTDRLTRMTDDPEWAREIARAVLEETGQ